MKTTKKKIPYEQEQPRASMGLQKYQISHEQDGGKDAPIGDKYDLYELASRVHSTAISGLITRDFTLSDMKEDVLQAKLPKFVKEQVKMVHIIRDYIILPDETLERKYNTPEKRRAVKKQLTEIAEKAQRLLMSELYTLAIMSRAKNGKVIDAFLRPEGTPEPEEQPVPKGLLQRIGDKLSGK